MKQFVVIGLGRFGSSVARTLTKMGFEVLALDINEERVNELMDDVTHAVQVDATEEASLKALGIRNFDVAIVAIGHEIQASILITVMLKELGVNKVVAKAQTELHGKVLEKIGADKVVYPERDMGVRLAHALVSTNVLDQIAISPDYTILEAIAPPRFVGKTLKDSALRARYGINVLAIRRGENILVSPASDEVIMPEDVLVALGDNDSLANLER